ncbi:BTB domain-containing protein [Nephila pilipes]|uniref:BTB domain-containing protein n=1 Tax=Nephila pilipes TaxID=299642 RepID=A0A8X6PW61_NEPPI|nr:BTB domain-containing protein [Nephila pilipes]
MRFRSLRGGGQLVPKNAIRWKSDVAIGKYSTKFANKEEKTTYLEMFLGRIISRKSSKKKWEKEVSLKVRDDGYSIKVQKKLLLEHSAYFRELPEAEMKKHKKIDLKDISIAALQRIVTFMQTKSVRFLNHTEAIETLTAAQKYEFEELFEICINHLITALEPSNVCEVYEAALSLSLKQLEYFCLRMIDEKCDQVLQTRCFITLKKSTVLSIIKRNSLNISTELVVFKAIMSWGLNDSLSRGLDPDNPEMFLPVVRHLLNYVRFGMMSEVDLKDLEVDRCLRLLSSCELWKKNRSLSTTSQTSASSLDLEKVPRQYVLHYTHNLNAYESNQHTVKNGETFYLDVEILKGRIFLTCFKLAFRPFSTKMNTACLYVLLTATNVLTLEHRTTRGTFMNTSDEALLELQNPLSAKESERIQVELIVKRSENTCPLTIRKEVQIVMPDSKMVAMKITPVVADSGSEETGRCIFTEIQYFH